MLRHTDCGGDSNKQKRKTEKTRIIFSWFCKKSLEVSNYLYNFAFVLKYIPL